MCRHFFFFYSTPNIRLYPTNILKIGLLFKQKNFVQFKLGLEKLSIDNQNSDGLIRFLRHSILLIIHKIKNIHNPTNISKQSINM